MEVINPLNLPEIIATVGIYLPLWKQSPSLGFYDFNPTTLLACCRVNKTWQEALTPVIWYVYSGSVMRSIPKSVIVKNSRHFRIFLNDRSFSGPFECRHLKELVISWCDGELLPLVQANARSLTSLTWKGSSSPSPMRVIRLPRLDYNLLLKMAPNLRDLSLSHWTISSVEFVHLIQRCRHLTTLNLSAIDWIDLPPDETLHRSASPHGNPTTLESYHRPKEDPSALKYLRLDISVSKENAFVSLIHNCCSDLESLTLYSECADDMRSLIPVLRESCPKLATMEYVSRFSSALEGHDNLTDKDYADLVNCCRSGIKSLTVDIPWLDRAMTDALLQQSRTLETLNLRFYDQRPPDLPSRNSDYICMVLQHCFRLKHLSLVFTPFPLSNEEMMQLFDQPWACRDLETLVLSDVIMTAPDQGATSVTTQYQDHDPLPFNSATTAQSPSLLQQQEHQQQEGTDFPIYSAATVGNGGVGGDGGGGIGGGSVRGVPGRGSTPETTIPAPIVRSQPSARQLLFEQVRRLPNLHKLSLNHVTYAVESISSEFTPPPPASDRTLTATDFFNVGVSIGVMGRG
ncbi:hypothetical protein BGZ83_003283 [Gryganskiella cystojenkinii]|nr:hypothetical protein BGZ83_003283 [Gryganskiella cystojenkinii]